ncbi:MAG: class A beta-lactamase-related serine hydrolase [Actinomycetota bacterium]|nr:class A beta-lactamase-related serine hydrolase [Actinomycetota bacterium]
MDKKRAASRVVLSLLAAALCICATFSPATGAGVAVRRDILPELEGAGETMPSLSERLAGLARDSGGSYGIYLSVLESGEQAGHGEDEEFYAASCYKLFLVMYIYESAARGRIDLDRSITYEAGDVEGEEGVIQNQPPGTTYTTRDLCMYAIVYSDNVAARMLRRVYGYVPYRDYAASIGCSVSGRYGENLTTAREMGILLMRVVQFASINPLGQEVVSYLERSVQKWRIPTGLPDGVRVGNKTGDYLGYNNDIAVVFLEGLTYVLCVLSRGAPGDRVHVEASRLVYEDISRRYHGEGADQANAPLPSAWWFFAHAPTSAGTAAWLRVDNGGTGTAIVRVTCGEDAGAPAESMLYVPSRSVTSLYLGGIYGAGRDLTVSLTSGAPVRAERVVYYEKGGDWSLASSDAGLRYAATERCIGGSDAVDGMDSWLYVYNPGDGAVNCAVYAVAGSQSTKTPLALPARGRSSLRLGDLAGEGVGAAAYVLSDAPVLAEVITRPQ